MKKLYLIVIMFFLASGCGYANYKYIDASNCYITLSSKARVNIFKIHNLYLNEKEVIVGIYNDGTSLSRYNSINRASFKINYISCSDASKSQELKKLLSLIKVKNLNLK